MRKQKSFLFWAQLGVTLLTCAFLLVPVVQSMLAGLTNNFMHGLKSGLTLRWLAEVWRLYRDTMARSMLIGLACVTLDLMIGVPAAYVMSKARGRFTRFIEEVLVLPVAIPGLATALALIINYGGWTAFRTSWLFILVGHVIFTLPFMIRSVIAVIASFNLREIEEGAASLGAGFGRRFLTVVIPNAMPGVLAGALMAFTLSIGEFNLTWMLHTPLTKTLPVGLADSYASMRLEIGSAYTLTFFVMIIPLLIAMQWAAASKQPKPSQSTRQVSAMPGVAQRFKPLTTAQPSTTTASNVESGTAIRVTQCAKTFPDGTRALEPLDLRVQAGETVVILGPSGCGKTTLLRMIAGLEMPDSGGRVLFNDDDVTAVPIERRNVGMVFQSYALFPNMTVADNIAYGLKLRGDAPAARARRVDEMLAMMKIEELRQRRVTQLSGGQKQRVALARAIAVRPRVLLLDEPLTALDAKLREALRVEIDMLLRSIGITAVYVTHDQAEAMALGDRIVVMDHGRIAQIGSPREIYFRPQTRFVAEFIGTVNRLPATVADDALHVMDARIPLRDAPNVVVHAGQPALDLYFRPEHAAITFQGDGHFRANVLNAEFMGDRTRVLLNGSTPNAFYVETPGKQAFRAGDTVDVRLEAESLFTLHE